MPTIPELLDESEKNIKKLVSEIESIKSFRELNQTTVESLVSVSKALEETSKAIEPYKKRNLRLLFTILTVSIIINTLFLIANLIVLFIR